MEEKELTDEKSMFNYIANDVLGEVKPLYLRKRIVVDILDLIHRLKAEIERLTEEKKEVWDERNRICKGYWEAMDGCHQYREKILELQKQVDELKHRVESVTSHQKERRREVWNKAVKDTAKEILQPLDEITKTSKSMDNMGLSLIAKICSLKERYGVEEKQNG